MFKWIVEWLGFDHEEASNYLKRSRVEEPHKYLSIAIQLMIDVPAIFAALEIANLSVQAMTWNLQFLF